MFFFVALMPHFIDLCFCFCFLFYVMCCLTGPDVACLLSCPSLNVTRQSAEPWASKSTKVKLTHLPTTTCPPPPSPTDSLPHCSNTYRHNFQSVVQIRRVVRGPPLPSLQQRLLEMALEVCAEVDVLSLQTPLHLAVSCLQHFLSKIVQLA